MGGQLPNKAFFIRKDNQVPVAIYLPESGSVHFTHEHTIWLFASAWFKMYVSHLNCQKCHTATEQICKHLRVSYLYLVFSKMFVAR